MGVRKWVTVVTCVGLRSGVLAPRYACRARERICAEGGALLETCPFAFLTAFFKNASGKRYRSWPAAVQCWNLGRQLVTVGGKLVLTAGWLSPQLQLLSSPPARTMRIEQVSVIPLVCINQDAACQH
jgi:hypothetical protein